MSASVGGDPVRTSVEAFERRLADELELTDWRGLIVIVVAASGLEHEADRVCANAASRLALSDERVLHWAVRRDAGGRAQLREYNRARDRLLASKRLIYLRAGSAADVRFLRRVAPDLTAAVDVFVELEAEPKALASWDECAREIRALMIDRHATLDFTGLLPASVEQRRSRANSKTCSMSRPCSTAAGSYSVTPGPGRPPSSGTSRGPTRKGRMTRWNSAARFRC